MMNKFLILLSLLASCWACSPGPATSILDEGDAVELDLPGVPSENIEGNAPHCVGEKCLYLFQDVNGVQEWYLIHRSPRARFAFRLRCSRTQDVQEALGMYVNPLLLDIKLKISGQFANHYKPEKNPELSCADPQEQDNRFYGEYSSFYDKSHFFFQFDGDKYRSFVFDEVSCSREIKLWERVSKASKHATTNPDELYADDTLVFDCSHAEPAIDPNSLDKSEGWYIYEGRNEDELASSYFYLVRYRWSNQESGGFVVARYSNDSISGPLNDQNKDEVRDYLAIAFPNATFRTLYRGFFDPDPPVPFSTYWNDFRNKPVVAFAKTQRALMPLVGKTASSRWIYSPPSAIAGHTVYEVTAEITKDRAFPSGFGKIGFGDGRSAVGSLQTLSIPDQEGTITRVSNLHLLERCENSTWAGLAGAIGLTTQLSATDWNWNETKFADKDVYESRRSFAEKILKAIPFQSNRLPCVSARKLCKLTADSDAKLTQYLRGSIPASACEQASTTTDLQIELKKEGMDQSFKVKGPFVLDPRESLGMVFPVLNRIKIYGGNIGEKTPVVMSCTGCFTSEYMCPKSALNRDRYPLLALNGFQIVELENLEFVPGSIIPDSDAETNNLLAAIAVKEVGRASLRSVKISGAPTTVNQKFSYGLCSNQTNLFLQDTDAQVHAIGLMIDGKTQVLSQDLQTIRDFGLLKETSMKKNTIEANVHLQSRSLEISGDANLIAFDQSFSAVFGAFLQGPGLVNDAPAHSGPSVNINRSRLTSSVTDNSHAYRPSMIRMKGLISSPSFIRKTDVSGFDFLLSVTRSGQPEGAERFNNVVFEDFSENIAVGFNVAKIDLPYPTVGNVCNGFDMTKKVCFKPF